jgi:hypothetical protein
MKPKFKHDCSGCKYLGTAKYDGKIADWYVCNEGLDLGASIIMRYSDDGPDYTSYPFEIFVRIINQGIFAMRQGSTFRREGN